MNKEIIIGQESILAFLYHRPEFLHIGCNEIVGKLINNKCTNSQISALSTEYYKKYAKWGNKAKKVSEYIDDQINKENAIWKAAGADVKAYLFELDDLFPTIASSFNKFAGFKGIANKENKKIINILLEFPTLDEGEKETNLSSWEETLRNTLSDVLFGLMIDKFKVDNDESEG